MYSNKTTGRISGVLFLIIFILGVTIYQVLQSPILTPGGFLVNTSANSTSIILSTLLGYSNGILSIIVSILLLPIIKKKSQQLGYLYITFCVLNFIAIAIDNSSVMSMLELSKVYVNDQTKDLDTFNALGAVFYGKHWWTHYTSLLISCLPVFTLFYTFYITRLIPKIWSVGGIIAVTLMFIEMLLSMFNNGIGMNMMLPLGLVQLTLPFWLIIKGFKAEGPN